MGHDRSSSFSSLAASTCAPPVNNSFSHITTDSPTASGSPMNSPSPTISPYASPMDSPMDSTATLQKMSLEPPSQQQQQQQTTKANNNTFVHKLFK